MLCDDNFVLMMVYVDEDRTDLAGNQYPYPLHSPVMAKEFSNDIDIQKGLYGILWGKTDYLIYEKLNSGYWIVLKVEKNHELICVNKFYNRYKFKTGIIVKNGRLWDCAQYIFNNKNDPEILEEAKHIQEKDIIGTRPWNTNRREENKKLITV